MGCNFIPPRPSNANTYTVASNVDTTNQKGVQGLIDRGTVNKTSLIDKHLGATRKDAAFVRDYVHLCVSVAMEIVMFLSSTLIRSEFHIILFQF